MISSLDLARICGVSQGTVDRALHNRPGVSAKTRQRILLAAARHGYAPNPSVQEMIRGESSIVGAVTPALNSLFFSDLFEHLQKKLTPHGLRLVMTAAGTVDEFLSALQDFSSRRCRAAVVVPPEDLIHIPEILTGKMPVVSLASPVNGANTHFIAADEIATGRNAVDYFYEAGHRRIAHMTYTRNALAIRNRRDGYCQRMEERGLTPLVVTRPPDMNVVAELADRNISAVFTHNDWLAITLLHQIQQAGLRVPDDISILGVDDSPTFTGIFPNLTTMRYPFDAIADRACALICGQPVEQTTLRLQIIERMTVRRINVEPMK